MSDDHKHFNAEKIFIILFAFTALEIGWGFFGEWIEMGRFWLWGVLGLCAYVKFVYILKYFMHFQYEGWIVKALMVPTIPLMLVIFFNTRPDIASQGYKDHPNGYQLDPRTGEVMPMGFDDERLQGFDSH